MAEVLRRDATYPGPDTWRSGTRYRWTGEKRPPKAGELYLSGAEIAAYRTQGDLSYPYHIAEAVVMVECFGCRGKGKVPKR